MIVFVGPYVFVIVVLDHNTLPLNIAMFSKIFMRLT